MSLPLEEVLRSVDQLSALEQLEVVSYISDRLKRHELQKPKREWLDMFSSDSSWKTDLHPSIQGLIGAISSEGEDQQELYVDYLEEKYR
ncbi:MAG: hypothetical protein HC799_16555 [Limnothrix sp. RL_2_0]|nr:hypothetical protein [Limnothrix sp. RL_2_0]